MKRPRRVPMWRAVVHLKSGGWFDLVAEEIGITRTPEGGFSEVTWSGAGGRVVPLGFDLREVEAVTAQ